MILFIDDDAEDLNLISEMAGIVGLPYPVVTFQKTEAALNFILQEVGNIKIIVTDVNMPLMDGFQLRRELMQMGSDYAMIPFILVSGSRSEVEELLAKELDIHTFYKKPSTFMGMKEIILGLKSLL